MAVITRSTHPWALWPGVKRTFGRAYNEIERQYSQIFEMDTSDRAYEDEPEITGFGPAPVKPEGTALQYDQESPGPTSRYYHTAYSLGYMVTHEELRDGMYEEVSDRRAEALAFSFRQTKEIVGANVLNRAFNSSYVGGDGVQLIASTHPILAGTGSNVLAVAADLSEQALEDAVTLIRQMTNSRGLRIATKARKLVVSSGDWANAARILNSVNTPGSNNNDINVLRSQNIFRDGLVVNDYLTDTDAWFIITDVPRGLVHFEREAMQFEQDNDFDTKNAKASGYERYSFGWSDWRGIVGSPGA